MDAHPIRGGMYFLKSIVNGLLPLIAWKGELDRIIFKNSLKLGRANDYHLLDLTHIEKNLQALQNKRTAPQR